ncbi:MmcQ/YjbR family DNA-binding protein [Klebsiella pasteurii]|uniref:MmcQ/YjbR family DNA-binding protein n=1 Tax=Klebsiella pasteurii TaxID=2587529 RepID=A0ABT5CNL6_9ENTR|nr:MmcQ/YjbR family DNA-binding protein [Klebsiella pasteurii]MBG2718509.1 MmcQ/YjbR family DNA-binding protein [Klebsiella michiganensis]MDC0693076.1 MmcQ/YjbR family DNA-binding protein [Klebsiella pasteurii]MDC0754983.1 MmcQ/YjbR family DNA-binding protein [Klebsiella pasteurii]MDQ2167702.1 MmcQ/YjbR family DNA-binding protein [Klebsiella pasteurii]MDQ2201389.1 MmcQ/YjbR family DNA-binding protein [Klebsiella pasteurii]
MNRSALFSYIREHYQTEPEYLWQHLPDYAVLRHQKGKKWFALVMNVPGGRLGLSTDEDIDILELKIRPEHIGSLRNKEGVLPAYHMNKEHWISVILSGPLTEREIHDLLSESYGLTTA